MILPAKVQHYLDDGPLEYRLVAESGDPGTALPVRSLLLQDQRGLLLALHETRRLLDIAALRAALRRTLDPAPAEAAAWHFPDCDPGHPPALALPYQVPVVLGTELLTEGDLDLPSGRRGTRLRVGGPAFRRLQAGAPYHPFAHPVESMGPADPLERQAAEILRARVGRIRQLPAMPEISHRILQLRIDPRARASDLANLVENDPGLAAQVIRRACSSLYGYRGRIDSVRDAIVRVLGFDQVIQLALGLAIGQAFRVPRGGQAGLHALWRQSIYCSVLVANLTRRMPQAGRPVAGLASLAGLFHNFGRLLLGHSFPSEFLQLNRLLAVNEHLPAPAVERYLLGVEDTELGAWLMQAWRLPEEVVTAVRRHRHPDYRGPHYPYAALVGIAKRLLQPHGLAETSGSRLPPGMLEDLGLDTDRALQALDETLADVEGLDHLSLQLGQVSH